MHLMPSQLTDDRTDEPTGLNRRYAHLHTPKHLTNADHLGLRPSPAIRWETTGILAKACSPAKIAAAGSAMTAKLLD